MWGPGLGSQRGVGSMAGLTEGCGVHGRAHRGVCCPWQGSQRGVGSMAGLTEGCGVHDRAHRGVWVPGLGSQRGVGSMAGLTEGCGVHGRVHRGVWVPGLGSMAPTVAQLPPTLPPIDGAASCSAFWDGCVPRSCPSLGALLPCASGGRE